MLIHSHFPKETKWQLLNKIFFLSSEQFLSVVHLNECFDSNGFETISPDSFLINEEYININLICNKKIKNIFIVYCDYIDYMGKEKTIN